MAIQYPNRKGFVYSFQSFSLMDGSDLIEGLLGFKASPKLDGRKLVYGTGRKAYGRTRGTLSVECEVTFLAEAFYEWRKKHPKFLDEAFNLVGINEEGANRSKIEVISLAFESAELTFEGTDELKGVLPGTAIYLLIDGESPIQGDSLGLGTDAGAG
jgi:hypothetical protein